MEKNEIKGVVVENKGGRTVFLADIVIDCTGDGDVAARAGAPFEIGNEKSEVQPMTLMFRMSNIDYIQDYYKFPHNEDNELIHMLDSGLERKGIKDYPFNYRAPMCPPDAGRTYRDMPVHPYQKQKRSRPGGTDKGRDRRQARGTALRKASEEYTSSI